MVISLILATQLAEAAPAKAASYFSPAALSSPLPSCGNRAQRPAISDLEASWFSTVWIRAGEPSLAAAGSASPLTTWRFTDIPTPTAPMIFRISQEAGGHLHMIAKRLSGRGGYDPGVLKDQIDRNLTSEEQERFQKALTSIDEVLVKSVDTCVIILDGDELIMERSRAGQYVIGQQFWQAGKPMAGMNELLSGFAGWKR